MVPQKHCRALFLILSLALLACTPSDEPQSAATTTVRSVKTVTASRYAAGKTRVLSGYLQAGRITDLSFQVQGQVLEVLAAPGDQVVEGQLLARIDPNPFELRVKTAEADLQRARADLRESAEIYQSQKRVYEQQYISKTTFERASAEFSRAESGVSSAESRLALARRDLAHTRIKAPFDGVITKRSLEPFQMVASSIAVFEIQGESELEVSFLLPENLADKVLIGTRIEIAHPDAAQLPIPAVITERSIKTDTKGSFPVVASVIEPPPGLLAGVAVEVRLTEQATNEHILLPEAAAAVDETGQHYVFVYLPQSSTVTRRPIIRNWHSEDRITVHSGVSEGDIVVVAGVEFLRDGQAVEVYRTPGIAAVPAPPTSQ
jgi:RND family efflux transporter MFP subunit